MARFIALLSCTSALALLSGCGPKLYPVNGVVVHDGKAVEGAVVTFVSEDGNRSYSGYTNAEGQFTLDDGTTPGALGGNYKVLVIRGTKKSAGEVTDPTEAAKIMKKDAEESAKSAKTGMPDMKKMMGKPPAGPPIALPGTAGVKSELPVLYATANTTPLTAKVPSEGPIRLELKGK